MRGSALFSFAGVYDRAGRMLCASRTPPPGWRFPEEMRPALEATEPLVGVLEEARLSGRPVLFAQHPLKDPDGAVIAFAAVSVPHDLVSAPEPAPAAAPQDRTGELFTFAADGRILTGPADAARRAALLPSDRALAALAGDRGLAFTAPAANGTLRVFAVVPLVPDQVYALGSWPVDEQAGAGLAGLLPPAAMPLAMWLVSLAVALLAAERLVTRHVRRLTAALARFARGERVVPVLDMHDAPCEIAALADSFAKMADAIIREEAERDDTIRQKEMLLREVHHRVKNNLQLIASIMNLQIRRARSAEARSLLRSLQERVMSLATVHRGLYQASSLAALEAGQLIEDILRQVLHMGADHERRFRLRKRIDRVVLSPDQAVPLALWFTEALTNAMKYAHGADDEGPARLDVTLTAGPGGRVDLVLANSVAAEPAADPLAETEPGGGLGSQLLQAFAEQLGGRFHAEEAAGWHRVTLAFTAEAPAAAPPGGGTQAEAEPGAGDAPGDRAAPQA